MDFSEIDIWWLLNKHIRIKREVSEVQNKIYYLYNEEYDKDKHDIMEALTAFEVECKGIVADNNYIENIFEKIERTW